MAGNFGIEDDGSPHQEDLFPWDEEPEEENIEDWPLDEIEDIIFTED